MFLICEKRLVLRFLGTNELIKFLSMNALRNTKIRESTFENKLGI